MEVLWWIFEVVGWLSSAYWIYRGVVKFIGLFTIDQWW